MQTHRYGLGIDTGGTYTDAALYSHDEGVVIQSAKAPTTPHDFSLGIAAALDGLDPNALAGADMVSLSTTLATNACVEGRGGRAALLLLGYDARLVDRLCAEYGLPRESLTLLGGRHDQRGEVFEEPDWEAVGAWVRKAAASCDALGVAEYWGVRNPAFEARALAVLREESRLPLAAAHQLTSEINSLKRAATTLLNLRLIPLMDELLRAVENALSQRGADAPLWIVRGDGTLMSARSALETPVELLLSGPAASAQGGGHLSALSDCLVVDVGGTTTDVAVLREGRVALEDRGAIVGGWRTGTRAARVQSCALGGDTRLTLSKDEGLMLDVRRALPLCRLALMMPSIKAELTAMIEQNDRRGYAQGEYLMLSRDAGAQGSDTHERKILHALKDGPLSLDALAAKLGTRAYFIDTSRLESSGALLRCALTLTDLWHVAGHMDLFDTEASRLGIELLAQRLEMEPDELMQKAFRLADRRMFNLLAGHLLARHNEKAAIGDALSLAFDGAGGELAIRFQTPLPLVGIGAPAHLLLPKAAQLLGTKAILPDNAGVGGAVGAITGVVAAEAEAVVRPIYEAWGVEGYACHTPDAVSRHDTLEEAREQAEKSARAAALWRAADMGAASPTVMSAWRDKSGKAAGREAVSFLLEAVVTARAVGKAQ